MGGRGLDACRGRFERGVWGGDGCPAEVARCRTRRLVGRRDRFGPRAAELLVASVLPHASTRALIHENETLGAPRRVADGTGVPQSSRSATDAPLVMEAACSPFLF